MRRDARQLMIKLALTVAPHRANALGRP
jgi:hypothetical protein